MTRKGWLKGMLSAAVALCTIAAGTYANATAIVLSGVGPVNRSMAGAATAAPIDAAGALHWNPGSISGLQQSEVTFGMELLLPTEELGSSIAGGPFAYTKGEPGVAAIPTIGWVHKPEGSRLTYGLGMYGVAGFKLVYPQDANNPIASQGTISTDVQILQIAPTVSYAVTDKLSIGFAPTLTLAQLAINPLLLSEPVGAGPGGPIYSEGTSTRYAFGGGAQVGIYYITDSCWHLGFSIKSPQWLENFRYHKSDGTVGEVDFDYPMILSLGLAYTGFERLLLAADFRYLDYDNTNGFKDAGISPTGKLAGLDWPSIVSAHFAAQYRWSDRLYLRGGYAVNESPITSGNLQANLASPLMYQHTLSLGMSYHLNCHIAFNLAYLHAFENTVTSDWVQPGIPEGSRLSTTVSADALALGFTIRY